MINRHRRTATITCLALLASSSAWAHTEEGVIGGFISGFLHPIYGLDHLVAMVAVGMWGTFLGNPGIWLLPVVFPLIMALGGALGVLGVPLPLVEMGIASSAVVLGMMVLLAAKPPLWVATVIVGVFAVFHGHAHGTELPGAANPLSYAIGFVLATGLMHLAGIGIGVLSRWPAGALLVRGGGGIVATLGILFLAGLI